MNNKLKYKFKILNINTDNYEFDETINLLSNDFINDNKVLPMCLAGDTLSVVAAMANETLIEEISRITGKFVVYFQDDKCRIEKHIKNIMDKNNE